MPEGPQDTAERRKRQDRVCLLRSPGKRLSPVNGATAVIYKVSDEEFLASRTQ